MSAQPGSGNFGSSGNAGSSGQGESFGQKAGETASEAKTAVQDKMTSGADQGMDKAAQGLGSAAEKMRTRAEDDQGMRSTIEVKAADAMDKTASYLKEHDSQELMHDIEEFVKAHPMQAAVGALAAGYVLGKIVR
jgi:ElaB/YqjD/DUF883 family membrane-anchored ribosome-binding protein